jgi:hypothetical protein
VWKSKAGDSTLASASVSGPGRPHPLTVLLSEARCSVRGHAGDPLKDAIYDPTSNASLGKESLRKANQWGGLVGLSITWETELEACPDEILGQLDKAVKK